jgi:hypothetical protein
MAEGPPDDLDDERPEEGPILSPDELDISESEHVEQLDEGRFVVSPDGPPNPNRNDQSQSQTQSRSQNTNNPRQDDDPSEYTQQSQPQRTQQSGPEPRQQNQPQQNPSRQQNKQQQSRQQQPQGQRGELSQEDVHTWLRRSFERSNSRYAFDVTATFDGSVSQRRMASNDVVTIFESLILWYAQQVDSNTPVEEILGILLMESNVPIRYPPETVHRLVKSAGLGPEDSIADLLEAIQQEDGLKL